MMRQMVQAPQTSNASQLGSLIKTYQMRSTLMGLILFCLLIALYLLALGFITWIFVLGPNGYLNSPSPYHPPLSGVLTMFFIPTMIAFSMLNGLRSIPWIVTPIHRQTTVELYTNGFIYRTWRKRQIIVWEQIKSIQRQSAKLWKKPRTFYMLQLIDSSKIALEVNMRNVQELGETIEQAVMVKRLPPLLDDYQTGRQIIFSGLCITREHVAGGYDRLPWSQISEIIIDQEYLTIREKGSTTTEWEKAAARPWFSAPISQFPNICMLVGLLMSIKEKQDVNVITRGTLLK